MGDSRKRLHALVEDIADRTTATTVVEVAKVVLAGDRDLVEEWLVEDTERLVRKEIGPVLGQRRRDEMRRVTLERVISGRTGEIFSLPDPEDIWVLKFVVDDDDTHKSLEVMDREDHLYVALHYREAESISAVRAEAHEQVADRLVGTQTTKEALTIEEVIEIFTAAYGGTTT